MSFREERISREKPGRTTPLPSGNPEPLPPSLRWFGGRHSPLRLGVGLRAALALREQEAQLLGGILGRDEPRAQESVVVERPAQRAIEGGPQEDVFVERA